MSKDRAGDHFIQLILCLLLIIGVVAMVIGSTYAAEKDNHHRLFFVQRQMLWALIGIAAFLISKRVAADTWQRVWPWLLAASLAGCLMLIVAKPLCSQVKGMYRWVDVGPFSLQPMEFLKLSLVMALAWWYTRRGGNSKQLWPGLGVGLLVLALACLIVMPQRDFGSTTILVIIGLVMPFAAGARPSHIGMAVAGLAVVATPALLASHRFERILAFLGLASTNAGAAYQQQQAGLALRAGGIQGAGLGLGVGKKIIPEAHTDFILAPFAEETGLLGSVLVVFLFALLMKHGFTIAARQRTQFGRLVATGITTYICSQALINLGVVTGALPCTGVPLPFISYGGSSILSCSLALGILSSLSRDVYVNGGYSDEANSDGGWDGGTYISGPFGSAGGSSASPSGRTLLRR